MKHPLPLSLYLLLMCFRQSVQDCRVLADCDGGQTRWKNLSQGARGIPGKKGIQGLTGQKGEPGLGVNVTDLKQYLKDENRGPRRFYYTPSLTWESSKTFCEQFHRTLCTHDEICVPQNGGRKLVGDVIPGDHWVAILDSQNDWVEVGTEHTWACRLHRPPFTGGRPSWGTSTDSAHYKGYVYCCEASVNTERSAPDIRFQYIGKATTYASSLEHCENQGRRLCYSSEVCSANKPQFGTAKGNNWIAVKDRYNEWIQIGVSGRTCGVYGIQYDPPAWGVREDGSLLDTIGFVYCCKKST